MRFTKSQDGILRATVWYKHRIGIDVVAFACFLNSDEPEKLTRKNIKNYIREYKVCESCGMWDDVDISELNRSFKRALELFPELITEENKKYLEEEKKIPSPTGTSEAVG